MTYRPSLEKLSHRLTQEDAWSSTFRPPPNETPQEKNDRIAKQQEAARISKEIDDSIEKSRKLLERKNNAIKILLLGQAESGKSTMLRNFQLAFCPTYFQTEISIWKTIIQLNIIGSVKRLLSIIEDELEHQTNKSLTSPSVRSRSRVSPSTRVSDATSTRARPPTASSVTSGDNLDTPAQGNRRRTNTSPTSSDVLPSTGITSSARTATSPMRVGAPPASSGGKGRRPSLSVFDVTTVSNSRLDVFSSDDNSRAGTFPSRSNPISHSSSSLDAHTGSSGPEAGPTPTPRSPASPHQDISQDPPLTSHHAALRLRLLPLLSVETNLTRQLLPDSVGTGAHASNRMLSAPSSGWTKWASGASGETSPSLGGVGWDSGEICVRAGGGWKNVLAKVSGGGGGDEPASGQQHQPGRRQGSLDASHHHRPTRPHPSDPTPLLHALTPDIHALWTDPAVQALLKRKGVRMEQSAGFFLNDVKRIGRSDWTPAFDDIVRARVRTFGVEEHKFLMDNGSEWYIYDVGGSRSMRHQWVPYFDDVQAIIFLAPLVFNQVLDEDRMINRLEDSVHLWKQVCSNPLLARANIILFLNKMDILEATLKAGIRVETYVPSYGNLPNEVESVVKYFKDKFRGYHKRLSPRPRTFFCHETSAVDIKATQAVLTGVREGILRRHLEELSVI